MDISQEQLVLRGAGSIRVDLEAESASQTQQFGPVRISIELGIPGNDLPVRFDVSLTRASRFEGHEDAGRWTIDRGLDA